MEMNNFFKKFNVPTLYLSKIIRKNCTEGKREKWHNTVQSKGSQFNLSCLKCVHGKRYVWIISKTMKKRQTNTVCQVGC